MAAHCQADRLSADAAGAIQDWAAGRRRGQEACKNLGLVMNGSIPILEDQMVAFSQLVIESVVHRNVLNLLRPLAMAGNHLLKYVRGPASNPRGPHISSIPGWIGRAAIEREPGPRRH